MHATFETQAANLVTSRVRGVVGVDLNKGKLSYCLVKPDGNPWKTPDGNIVKGDIPLVVSHLSAKQAKAALLDAINQVVAIAVLYQATVGIEDLNFEVKKSKLREQPKGYARMLSRLTTSGFEQAITSRCRKLGIPLHKVNPAWSSVAGFAKYGIKHGFSIDQAAGFQIGRIALLGIDPRRETPTHTKAGKLITPAFRRKLEAKQTSKVIHFQEPVGFSRPLPVKLQSKLDGQSGCNSWKVVRKVLGERKNWRSNLLGHSLAAGLSSFRKPPTQVGVSSRRPLGPGLACEDQGEI